MLSIAILAGGRSQRMGQDKALMAFRGERLIERVYRRLQNAADEIFIITDDTDKFRFMGCRIVPDLLPGIGSLGGLLTAMEAASYPLTAVVACDLPFVNSSLLHYSGDQLVRTPEAVAAIPQTIKGFEPFHAVYRREACVLSIRNAVERGERKVTSWLGDKPIVVIQGAELALLDPNGLSFINLNTPEDFLKAESNAEFPGLEGSME